MRIVSFVNVVLAIFVFGQEVAMACSVCRCGDQSFFINNARQLTAGRWLFAVEHFNTRKSATVVHHHAEGLAPRLSLSKMQHEELGTESQVQNAVQLNLKYGLTNRLMLMASAPYTFNRITMAEDTETADGFGDPEIMAIAQVLDFAHGTWMLQASAGARVPLGASDQTDQTGTRLEQHLQTGSGAWAGIFGVHLMRGSGSLPLFLGASYQTNGKNDHDFSYGHVFRFNAAAQKALAGSFDLIAEVNGRVADYDTEGATTDPNSGGTAVYLSPGLRWRFGGLFSLRSQVQIPVLENLHGEQNEKVNVRTGLVWEL